MSDNNLQIGGGCLCRAVRYKITAHPIVTRVCWRRLCQYLGAERDSMSVSRVRPSRFLDPCRITAEWRIVATSCTEDSAGLAVRSYSAKPRRGRI